MTLGLTVAMLRRSLDQVPSGAQEEAQLSRFLAEAESIVEDALRWVAFDDYGSAAARDVRVSDSTQWLRLPAHQTGSVTTVVKVLSRGTSAESLETLTDAEEAEDGQYLYRDQGWPAGTWARITAVWGYGPAPESIQRIAYELATNLYRGKDAGFYEAIGAEDGGRTVYTGGLNASHRRIIESTQRKYRGSYTP